MKVKTPSSAKHGSSSTPALPHVPLQCSLPPLFHHALPWWQWTSQSVDSHLSFSPPPLLLPPHHPPPHHHHHFRRYSRSHDPRLRFETALLWKADKQKKEMLRRRTWAAFLLSNRWNQWHQYGWQQVFDIHGSFPLPVSLSACLSGTNSLPP